MAVEVPSTFDNVGSLGASIESYKTTGATRFKLVFAIVITLGITVATAVSILLFSGAKDLDEAIHRAITPSLAERSRQSYHNGQVVQ